MTENGNPVFFSTHLHEDLAHAFEDLRKVREEITEAIRLVEDAAAQSSDKEREAELRSYADIFLGSVDDLEKWITTYEAAVNAKLAGNPLVYERDTYQTLVRILQWDCIDVRQLARWIREMKELTSHIGLNVPYLLHVKQIPTEPIPEDVVKYPVFIMDRQGYCLCGMDLAEIRFIDEVRELMAER
ncbi:MAG: hypothetical protein LBU24_00930 [Methanocalculaceae archaeon]|jgi:hypothetical protein|nr:hypothetical protein [Methanocalculaceae archaeon]